MPGLSAYAPRDVNSGGFGWQGGGPWQEPLMEHLAKVPIGRAGYDRQMIQEIDRGQVAPPAYAPIIKNPPDMSTPESEHPELPYYNKRPWYMNQSPAEDYPSDMTRKGFNDTVNPWLDWLMHYFTQRQKLQDPNQIQPVKRVEPGMSKFNSTVNNPRDWVRQPMIQAPARDNLVDRMPMDRQSVAPY